MTKTAGEDQKQETITGCTDLSIVEAGPTELPAIGALRVAVWAGEGVLAPEIEAKGEWLDDFDVGCRHWIVRDPQEPARLLASGRLTCHHDLMQSPDGAIWNEHGRLLPLPVGNLGKLVVRREARGLGLASRLNAVRISAARAMGIKSLTVTASHANARLLLKEGFHDTGWVVRFSNRPEVPFLALELILEA